MRTIQLLLVISFFSSHSFSQNNKLSPEQLRKFHEIDSQYHQQGNQEQQPQQKSTKREATFFIGDKTYPCTREYFLVSGEELGHEKETLSILLVKDKNQLMVVFNQKSTFSNTKVCGTLIFYLDDNTLIKLLDKKKYDQVDGIYTSVYFLNETETTKLKVNNIRKIRYNSCQGDDGDGDLANSFTNEKIDFPQIITNLFNTGN